MPLRSSRHLSPPFVGVALSSPMHGGEVPRPPIKEARLGDKPQSGFLFEARSSAGGIGHLIEVLNGDISSA